MTEDMARLFVDVHPSSTELTLYPHGNSFLIALMVIEYSIQYMLRWVVAEGSTRSLHNALYDHRSLRCEIA